MSRSKTLLITMLLLAVSAVGATAAAARSTAGANGYFFHSPNGRVFWQDIKSNFSPFGAGPTGSFRPGPTGANAPASTKGEKQLRSLNHQVAAAINNFRVAHGLNALHISTALNRSARQHSFEMGADGYFDHNSADGTAWWKRIQHYYTATGYPYWTAGENLLWASPSISASDALKLWIGSPEHLANLKNKDWRDLGVSAVHVRHAGGVYDGNDVTIITTDFGARHH